MSPLMNPTRPSEEPHELSHLSPPPYSPSHTFLTNPEGQPPPYCSHPVSQREQDEQAYQRHLYLAALRPKLTLAQYRFFQQIHNQRQYQYQNQNQHHDQNHNQHQNLNHDPNPNLHPRPNQNPNPSPNPSPNPTPNPSLNLSRGLEPNETRLHRLAERDHLLSQNPQSWGLRQPRYYRVDDVDPQSGNDIDGGEVGMISRWMGWFVRIFGAGQGRRGDLAMYTFAI